MPISTIDTSSISGLGYGFKNRIINGGMVIDQRNAGASVATSSGSSAFGPDRFKFEYSATSKFTIQQNTTAPQGFVNSVLVTSSSAYTVAAGDVFYCAQYIEGLNVSDLGWGTANAQAVTLSFWVRSSLTGTFGGALQNSANNRSYPFTYTISAANTWELETITIPGDTTGTWLTTNGIGIALRFGLGVGSTYSGTAGAWAGSDFRSATGATSVVGTSGATFYITGVQLEKGTVATSFDWRPYGTELQLCQRYYQKLSDLIVSGYTTSGSSIYAYYTLPVEMRTAPTLTITQGGANNAGNAGSNNTNTKVIGVFAAITSTGVGYRLFTAEMNGAEL